MAAVDRLQGFPLVLHGGPGVAEFGQLLHLTREEGGGLREDFIRSGAFVVRAMNVDSTRCADAVAYEGRPFD